MIADADRLFDEMMETEAKQAAENLNEESRRVKD
jgi:hypothetical protein